MAASGRRAFPLVDPLPAPAPSHSPCRAISARFVPWKSFQAFQADPSRFWDWYIASLANRGLAHAFPLCAGRGAPPFWDVCAGPGRSEVKRGMHSDRGLPEEHAGMAECVKFRKRKGKASAPVSRRFRPLCMKLKLSNYDYLCIEIVGTDIFYIYFFENSS